MADLSTSSGELRFTLEIKRKETGRIEKYELIGRVKDNGSNSFDSGAGRRD